MDLSAECGGDAEILDDLDEDDDESRESGRQQQPQQQYPAPPGIGDMDSRRITDLAADRLPAGARRQHAEGQPFQAEQQYNARRADQQMLDQATAQPRPAEQNLEAGGDEVARQHEDQPEGERAHAVAGPGAAFEQEGEQNAGRGGERGGDEAELQRVEHGSGR